MTRLHLGLGLVALCVPVLLLATAPAAEMTGSGTPQAADSLWALSFTTGSAWRADRAPGDQAGFAAHSRNLSRLRTEGRILMGGRYGTVGLMLVRAGSEAEVRQLLAADSAVAAGVFHAEITVWRTVYDGNVPRR